MQQHDVAIVGAGPIGIELAIALRRLDFDVVHFEGGQIGQTMYLWPPGTRWFSSPERIAIAGVPIQSATQSKCTREEYLAYLRTVVLHFDLKIRTFERVTELRTAGEEFILTSETLTGRTGRCRARHVVLATGGTARPNQLGIPGEDLLHASHHLEDPHRYFGRQVVVIGGRNSAVEAALRCHHAGARVAICYRGEQLPSGVKYWLRPEIEHLIATGAIGGHFLTTPLEITADAVTLRRLDEDSALSLPADFVLLMTGYVADMELFAQTGVELDGERQVPSFDPQTMETDVPRLFVAGTATAGTQRSGVRVFLENCHVHVDRIVAALVGSVPPPTPVPLQLPEA